MYLAGRSVTVGCVVALLCGGGLARVTRLDLRYLPLLAGGAALETLAAVWGAGAVPLGLLLAGYALLVAFALANARLPGMILVAAGLAANMTVMALDGGMPVRGVAAGAHLGLRHHPEGPGDRLRGLADVVHLGWLDQTVSAGDVCLSLGAATVAWIALDPPPVIPRLRRRRVPSP